MNHFRLFPTPWRLVTAVALVLSACGAHALELTVSAAASLGDAFRELGSAYEIRNPGTKVTFNFAASDALLTQIAKGAPVDVFASADQETMDRAQAQRLILPDTRRDFAANALVLVVPADSRLQIQALSDLKQAGVERIALGNPAGVPAGRYARGALDAQGLWTSLEGKAVFAQNVRQCLDYVARGEVQAGFVYATDIRTQADRVKAVLSVPTGKPIRYPVAVVADSAAAHSARGFVEFVVSPTGQAILARHGFLDAAR